MNIRFAPVFIILVIVVDFAGSNSLWGPTNRTIMSGIHTTETTFAITCTVVAMGIGQVVDRVVDMTVRKGTQRLSDNTLKGQKG